MVADPRLLEPEHMLARFDALDRALVAKGFTPTSPWWRETIEAFYARRRRQLVLRVGRRGGKSSTLCRLAVLEALYGGHAVPPGDIGVVAIISVSRDEASQRLRTIKAILDVLGVRYRPIEHGIELEGRPIAFKTFVATVAGVSGPTCIAVLCDEVAKWRDADTGANPAHEVLASLRPTMATQPRARLFMSSSPVGSQDAHAAAFDEGETDFQNVAHAPTWLANPTVSEASTHELEPDERIWKREYAAIPQTGVLGAFQTDDIDRAFEPRDLAGASEGPRVLVVDVSSGKKDAWTWGLCRWLWPEERSPVLRFEMIDGLHGAFWKTTNAVNVVERLARIAKEHGAFTVHGDQREEFMVRSEFSNQGVAFIAHPWTATSKPHAVETVRRWLREGALSLPEHEGMRAELHAFEERITPSGAFTFGARGSGHDDYVALAITAAMAHESRHLYAIEGPRKPRVESAAEVEERMREGRRKRAQFENEASPRDRMSARRQERLANWGREGARK